MSTHWPRVRELFERALELSRSEREAFVRAEAGDDDALAEQVLALLHNEQGLEDAPDASFLSSPVETTRALSAEPQRALETSVRAGDTVGAYTLIREIASGGMGTVFEATQGRPARTVALKVLRRGLHSSESVRRFELEAEVLGRLKHPGIASIFEAGVHRPGQHGPGDAPDLEIPYFALELVDGARDLTAYANESGLGLRERLGLFLEVAAAVHHAHQKGVIHRDLKPGNVLVGTDGQPKVIDYGVARLTDPESEQARPETIPGGALGTLPYMSPEQLAADADGVDVRTDVYGLGAILYELLTGRTPHATAGLPLAEAVRTICEEQPQAPSKVGPAPESGASLAGGVPEELDWICLRALEHDRERRYGTAAELADDVLRFLRHEPVSAGPPTAAYRLRKLYGRHRLPLTAAAFALLALIGGLIGTSIGLLRAREAERRADGERRLALEAKAEAEAAKDQAERERGVAEQATAAAASERERALEARAAESVERRRAELEAQKAREMLEFLADTLAAADPAETGRELSLIDYLDRANRLELVL